MEPYTPEAFDSASDRLLNLTPPTTKGGQEDLADALLHFTELVHAGNQMLDPTRQLPTLDAYRVQVRDLWPDATDDFHNSLANYMLAHDWFGAAEFMYIEADREADPTPPRPTFVMVWHDGTVTLDSPDSNKESGLVEYLQAYHLGHLDEPIANLYIVDREAEPTHTSPLGMPLVQVMLKQWKYEVASDDWIDIEYHVHKMNVSFVIDGGIARDQGIAHSYVTSLHLRIDGRA